MKDKFDKITANNTNKEKKFFKSFGNGIIRNIKGFMTIFISIFLYFMILDKIGFEKTIVLLISIVIFVLNKKNKEESDIF